MKRTLKERGEITKFYEEHGYKKTMHSFGLTKYQVKEIARWYRKHLLKKAEKFTIERILKFRAKCYSYISTTKWYDQADDFASWACVRALEGKEAPISLMYQRFIKELLGLDRAGLSTNEFIHEDITHLNSNEIRFEDNSLRQDQLLELNYIHKTFIEIGILDKTSISVLIMRFVYGFDLKDIGIILMLHIDTVEKTCSNFLETHKGKKDI